MKYLNATQEQGKAFVTRQIKGPVVMLNLLKFKDVADYRGLGLEANPVKISGKEAYQKYLDHTLPILQQAGGEVLFMGKSSQFLIGPEYVQWDVVLLVRHASIAQFLAFAKNPEYLKGIDHRTAALVDSRLLPIEEIDIVGF